MRKRPLRRSRRRLRPRRPGCRATAGSGSHLAWDAAPAAYPAALPLDRAAQVIAEAYAALGEIRPLAAASVALVPRPGGVLRCLLTEGDRDENRCFTSALGEILGGAVAPRHVISRLAWPADAAPGASLRWRALLGRWTLDVRWHPVPSDLASQRPRADAFHAAWSRWLGRSSLLFAGRTDEGRAARADAVSAAPELHPSRRTMWH